MRFAGWFLMGVLLAAAGCSAQSDRLPPEPSFDERIRLAADYLIRHMSPEGRFVYQVNLDGRPVKPRYNVLRHAGTLYALAVYAKETADERATVALERGLDHLRKVYIRPVQGRDMLAVFSNPAEEACTFRRKLEARAPVAKLGGSGLALVAMAWARRVAPRLASVEEMRKLGRFVVYMMKPSGQFYTRYRDGERDDETPSLYYPGEAIYGLALLHSVDAEGQWLGPAVRAARYLVKTRRSRNQVPPDHWLLIALGAMAASLDAGKEGGEDRRVITGHCVAIAESMIRSQAAVGQRVEPFGGFDEFGRSTPTATRLEGLLALRSVLPRGREAFAKKLDASIAAGISFLCRCQVLEGRGRGGVVRAVRPVTPSRSVSRARADELNRRQREVRIDYVQHAMCALMRHREVKARTAGD